MSTLHGGPAGGLATPATLPNPTSPHSTDSSAELHSIDGGDACAFEMHEAYTETLAAAEAPDNAAMKPTAADDEAENLRPHLRATTLDTMITAAGAGVCSMWAIESLKQQISPELPVQLTKLEILISIAVVVMVLPIMVIIMLGQRSYQRSNGSKGAVRMTQGLATIFAKEDITSPMTFKQQSKIMFKNVQGTTMAGACATYQEIVAKPFREDYMEAFALAVLLRSIVATTSVLKLGFLVETIFFPADGTGGADGLLFKLFVLTVFILVSIPVYRVFKRGFRGYNLANAETGVQYEENEAKKRAAKKLKKQG